MRGTVRCSQLKYPESGRIQMNIVRLRARLAVAVLLVAFGAFAIDGGAAVTVYSMKATFLAGR